MLDLLARTYDPGVVVRKIRHCPRVLGQRLGDLPPVDLPRPLRLAHEHRLALPTRKRHGVNFDGRIIAPPRPDCDDLLLREVVLSRAAPQVGSEGVLPWRSHEVIERGGDPEQG